MCFFLYKLQMRYHIPENIISIAHRGYSSKYKDNTFASFKNVRSKGFQMIELDIQLCKSGEIIVYHDLYLKGYKIKDLTLKEIKRKKKSIMTLVNFYNNFIKNNSYNTSFYFDMKGGDELAHRLFCFIKTYNVSINHIICCSFNKKHIDYLKNKIPELSVGLIISNTFNEEDTKKILKNINFLIVEWSMLDKEMIKTCHNNNVSVFTYTMDSYDVFNYIQDFEIDGIVSNYRLFHSKYGYYYSDF